MNLEAQKLCCGGGEAGPCPQQPRKGRFFPPLEQVHSGDEIPPADSFVKPGFCWSRPNRGSAGQERSAGRAASAAIRRCCRDQAGRLLRDVLISPGCKARPCWQAERVSLRSGSAERVPAPIWRAAEDSAGALSSWVSPRTGAWRRQPVCEVFFTGTKGEAGPLGSPGDEAIPPAFGDGSVPGEILTRLQFALLVWRRVYLCTSEAHLLQGKDALLPSVWVVSAAHAFGGTGAGTGALCCSSPAPAPSLGVCHPPGDIK